MARGRKRWRRSFSLLALGALLLTVERPLHAQESTQDLEQFRAELSAFFTQVSQLVDRLPDRPVPQIAEPAFAQAWTLLRFQPETLQLQINSLTVEDLATLRDAMNLAPHWQDLAPRALTILEGLDQTGFGPMSEYTTPITPFPAPNDSGANKTRPLDLDEPARTFCDAVDDNPASPGSNLALLISCDVFKGTCLGATIAAEAIPGCPDDELALPFGALVCMVKILIKTALQITAATLCSTKDLTCGFAASDSQCSVGLFFNGLKVMLDHRMGELASEQSVGLRAAAAYWGWCRASSFASCAVRTDCGLGEACVAGECVTIHTCNTDADCGGGGVCFTDPFATETLHAKLQNRLDVPVTSRATEDSVGVRAAASTAGWCRAAVDQGCAAKADCEVGQACVALKCVTVRPCAGDADCAPAPCIIDPFVTTNLQDKLNQRLDVKLTTRASEDSVEGQRGGPPIDRSMSVRTVVDRTNDVTIKRIQEKVRRLTAALADTGTALRELQERSTRFAIEENLRLRSPRQPPIVLFEMPDSVHTPAKHYCSQSVIIECASDTDCPPAVPAESCVANQCTRTCAFDSDCIRGGTCTAGVCQECAGNADCPNGRFCSSSGTCLSGQVCTTDAECPDLRAAETCVEQAAGIPGMLPKSSRIIQDVVDMTRNHAAKLCGDAVYCELYGGIDGAQSQVTQGNLDAGFHTIVPPSVPAAGVKEAYDHYRRAYKDAARLYSGVHPTPNPTP